MKTMKCLLRSKFLFHLLPILLVMMVCTNAHAQGGDNILAVPVASRAAGFLGNGNFNAIVFGNLTANAGDAEGRLAIKGDFSFTAAGNAYSVGIAGPGVGSLSASATTDNFIVNGNFNNSGNANWQVKGNFHYNTATGNTIVADNTTAGVTEHIKFADGTLLAYYRQLSNTLSALSSTGTVSQTNSWDPITLTGSNSGLNIFNITLPADHNTGFNINIPATATALINIHNASVVMSGGDVMINGQGISTSNYGAGAKVLFNFREATAISFSGFALLGNVLAPSANLTAIGGSINGQSIIGGHVSQRDGFEFHNFEFTGSIPTSVLPLSIINFTATPINNFIQLNWTTAQEINTAYFEVQRSKNNRDWSTIGTVSAAGNSEVTINYSFTDNTSLNSTNWYRLKMVDKDETFTYSVIRKVEIKNSSSLVKVYPNPVANGKLFLQYSNAENVKTIQLLNAVGIQVFSSVAVSEINISALPAGMYVLKTIFSNGTNATEKIIIKK